MAQILFITGTDTGVGKTFVAAALIRNLVSRGLRVFPFKPVETGCMNQSGQLLPADGAALLAAAGSPVALENVTPFRFELALAPSVASRSESRPIDLANIIERARRAEKEFDLVLMEGAGGLMVPLVDDFTFCDLIQELGAQVLLVVGSKLGCLNHSLLTIEIIQRRNLPFLGYVLNDLFAAESLHGGDISIETNRDSLAELADRCYSVRELAYVPYVATPNATVDLEGLSALIIEKFGLKG